MTVQHSEMLRELKWVCKWLLDAGGDAYYLDWKMWVGIPLWLGVWIYWLARGYDRSFGVKAIFVLGLDLAILHMLQFWVKKGMLLILVVLMFQNMLASRLFWKPHDLAKEGQYSAISVYMEISGSFLQCWFIFAGQAMFASFYFYSLFMHLEPEHFDYLFWVASYISVQMTLYFNRGADSQLGGVWDVALGADMVRHSSEYVYSFIGHRGKEHEPFQVSKAQMAIRCFMGWLVNLLFRDLVAFTVPIMLMQFEDPLNCVIYAVGVNFIITMDNMTPQVYDVTVKAASTDDLEAKPVQQDKDDCSTRLLRCNT